MYLTACPYGPGSILDHGRVFRGIFFLADHTLPTPPGSAWQKMAQFPLNGTTQPVDIEKESRIPIMDRE